MAIWLEVRCERRGDGRSPYGNYRCWSDDNDGPGTMAGDNKRDVVDTLRELSGECLSAGWKKIKGEGWVCPKCLAFERDSRGEVQND